MFVLLEKRQGWIYGSASCSCGAGRSRAPQLQACDGSRHARAGTLETQRLAQLSPEGSTGAAGGW